jgi:hypothetical protein
MSRSNASALTLVRVERGAPPPSAEQLRAALARDRERLHVPAIAAICDFTVAGPYAITVDGKDLDEYVVWER